MIPHDAITKRSKRGNELIIFGLKPYVEGQLRIGKYQEDKKNYKVECIYCSDAYHHNKSYTGPYLKYKMYVQKDMQLARCFRCNKVFINKDDNLRVDIPFPDDILEHSDFRLAKLTDDSQWNLELFNSFNEYDELGYNYLIKKRHQYFKTLYKTLGIRFRNHNPVIPFYYRGEFIYYQIKIAFSNSRLPYFSPPITYKPAYVIESGDNKRFVICEGTFDAIACSILYPDRTPYAILGSSISDYQITMLRSYVPEDILVYMDSTDLSIKVANKIRRYINYAEVSIRGSNGTDPEEYLKFKLLQETKIS
jgi:hypothetical protein